MEADLFDEELEMLLSEDAADKGPGFGWTSPEQSNIMFNHKETLWQKKLFKLNCSDCPCGTGEDNSCNYISK